MMKEIFFVFKHALMITGFVFVMMLVIEYINVLTQGVWQRNISGKKWQQYLLGAILGALPGCLGAFTVVSLFSHRLVSFGALVTAMIATSGDEAFIMFAMFPEKAILLTSIIFFVGIMAGYLTDKFFPAAKFQVHFPENKLPLHNEDKCNCFPKEKIIGFIIRPSAPRLALIVIIVSLIAGILTGALAGNSELWKKTTILMAFIFSLFIVLTVPDHFLKEHLWNHIVKIHIPRIFLWTFGTLLLIHFLMEFIDIGALIADNLLFVLVIAVLVGIIPESGPHLIFVTLFAQGSIPFSILVASSISQDGHGALPLLAESRKGFLAVKAVNVFFALIIGFTGYVAGY